MPRERPAPPPFEPESLERSLNRYLAWGLLFMLLLAGGFVAYRIREPDLRADAAREQAASYQMIGEQLFATACAECHGDGARGGASAPTLDAKQFLESTTDAQMRALIAGGISGSDMSAWGLDFGGTYTDEQVNQIVTYLRSLEDDAPSIPGWRSSDVAD